MNCRDVKEELSAYLDGEARDGRAVAHHLEQCPACAQRHRELRALSLALRALPTPDPHPDFAARVLDHVREASPIRPFPSRNVRTIVSWAAVAAITVGAALVWHWQRPRPVQPVVAHGPASGDVLSPSISPVTLEKDLARRLAWGEPLPEEYDWAIAVSSMDTATENGALLAGLAGQGWFQEFAAVVDDGTSIDELVQTLAPGESNVLEALLSGRMQERKRT